MRSGTTKVTGSEAKRVSFRIYGSSEIRRLLSAVAVLLIGVAGAAGTFGPVRSSAPPPLVGWMLVGAAITLFGVVAGTRPPEECAFCGERRTKVDFLLAGPSAAICAECSGLLVAGIAAEFERRREPREWHRLLVNGLPPQCPTKISQPLLELLADDRSAEELRETVSRCLKLQNNNLARRLLEEIPEADRTAGQWLNLGVALSACGELRAALASTSKALERDDATLRPWCLNNRAWFRVRLDPTAPADAKTEWLDEVEEATRLLLQMRPPGWKALLQHCYGTKAEIRRSIGDADGALRALEESEELAPLTGEQLLVRARIHRDAGRREDACADISEALDRLHPESMTATEAREFLATLE